MPLALLYALLFFSQLYLAFLAAVGLLPQPGRILRTLRYVSLAATFLWFALGTVEPPLIDMAEQRWLLRGSYIAYLLLCLYSILAYWFGLFTQARRRLAAAAQAQAQDQPRTPPEG